MDPENPENPPLPPLKLLEIEPVYQLIVNLNHHIVNANASQLLLDAFEDRENMEVFENVSQEDYIPGMEETERYLRLEQDMVREQLPAVIEGLEAFVRSMDDLNFADNDEEVLQKMEEKHAALQVGGDQEGGGKAEGEEAHEDEEEHEEYPMESTV